MSELTELTMPSAEVLTEVSLTPEEYKLAVEILQRTPNHVELGIIGALWSEHCSYKTSKPLLKKLPTTGDSVLQGPGENAGAVSIGNGLAVVFKIESHNHPSAIEPYQGAATGVGGILRDIFTMGARPVALLDSLRFGPFEEPQQRYLLDGVVAGIGGYGNCIGVPTVGGEVSFDPSYRYNCLVNAMCVGIIEQKKLTRAVAAGVGNSVLLVGADTGRDGIHGATFASVELDDKSEERRPAVQVGNPFLEKCLMEACLELAGDSRIVAMQDLGASGLTSSTAELAHRGNCGIEIDIDKVARREKGMTAFELMLSESQERMLIVVKTGHEAEIQNEFAKWDLHSGVVGQITESGCLVVVDDGKTVCNLPLDMLIDKVPLRFPTPVRPKEIDEFLLQDPLPKQVSWSHEESLLRLLSSPNIGSRRSIFQRYDHQVGNDTIIKPGGDAALVRVAKTNGAIAISTDGNSRYGVLDPKLGAAIAVAESARNVVATGAKPIAVTNCLNFGNPEKPDVFWQLDEAITGITKACEALDVPVVSGNVSLYNDTNGISIDPTPVIGMVGFLADVEKCCTADFKQDGDIIALVGPLGAELGGSEYQRLTCDINVGPRPQLDLDLEGRVQAAVLAAITAGQLQSAHDCSEGGLVVAITESALLGQRGVKIKLDTDDIRGPELAGLLFGETQSRFVISFSADNWANIEELALRQEVPLQVLGTVGGDKIEVEGHMIVSLAEVRVAYEKALESS